MIKMWLLATAIWFGVLGVIVVLIGLGSFFYGVSNKLECFIVMLVTTFVLSCIFGLLTTNMAMKDNKEWNNGVCPSCGQVWEFKGGSQCRGSYTYYYSCDDCHINIKQHILR